MANKLKQEDLTLNIIVNGNKAQSEIGKVSRSLRDAKSAADAVESEMKLLERQGLTNTKRYRELTSELARHRKEIEANRQRLSELNQSLRLEDQTMSALKRSLRELIKLRDQSVPDSKQYREYSNQIAQVSARISYLRNESERTGNVLTRMTGQMRAFVTSTVGSIASITAITIGVRKARDEYSQWDDKIADVMKTTDAARESVIGLNDELEKIDTRTSQEDLLGLARIGGKLGITDMDELRGFVASSNQLIVALNEDLGGNVEQTVNAVGKLVEIFGISDMFGMESGLLKVGSAINELGMASTANEGYMVEFSRRMAGVAPLAGISVQQILGLGATLDQLGQTAEVSSTALSKLFLKLSSDAASFAKYAGMEVSAFQELLEKDFMAAFTAVLNGVRSNSNGINELAATLGDLGLDGGRVIGVLGSLANNTNILTEQIDLANDAFARGTSLTDEYNIKNSTAAAQLEKARKEVTKFWRELGEKLWPAITDGNNLLAMFLRVLSTIITFISTNIRWISSLTVAFAAYTVAVKANSLALAINVRWTSLAKVAKVNLKVASLALSVVYGLLTGNITRATAAMRLLNVTMALNPAGLLVAAVAGLTYALYRYSERLSAVQKAQDLINKSNERAIELVKEEQSIIEKNSSIIADETKHRSNRLTAINELRKIMPEVLEAYTNEEILAGKATKAINEQSAAILYQARIREKAEQLARVVDDNKKYNAPREDGILGNVAKILVGEANYDYFTGRTREQYEDRISIERRLIKDLTELNEEYAKARLDLTVVDPYSPNIVPTGGKEKKTPKTEAEKQAERDRKAYEQMLADQKAYQEQVIFNTKSLREQEDIEYQKRLEKSGLFGKERSSLTEHELMVLDALESEHLDNISKIRYKEETARINAMNDEFEQRKLAFETQNLNELASIETFEQAKQLLRDKYEVIDLSEIKTFQEAKLEIQKKQQEATETMTLKHYETMLDFLRAILETEEWAERQGFSIMSDEEKQKLQAQIAQMEKLVASLRAIRAGGSPGGDGEGRDILGMSEKDWNVLVARINQAKQLVDALTDVWSDYNAYVAAGEKRALQEFEESNNKKKEQLQKRLDAGLLSQDSYNKQVQKLDAEYRKRKARIEYNQAKREKGVAIAKAISNTAVAITKAFSDAGPILGAVLAALVAASGALQIATIVRQPLPSLSGRESGGTLVQRQQDGKVFNAQVNPNKRGYVNRPTVIVGENGNEFVANAQAVENPSIRPILDIIDTAQRNGTISTLNLEKIMARSMVNRSMPGYARGGYVDRLNARTAPRVEDGSVTELREVVEKNTEAVEGLKAEIRRGIKAEVALLGRNGFYEKDAEYKSIQSSANL